MDAGYLIATPGEVVDYGIVEDVVIQNYKSHNVERVEADRWNATSVVTNLMEQDVNVSYFGQSIANMSFPTKTIVLTTTANGYSQNKDTGIE